MRGRLGPLGTTARALCALRVRLCICPISCGVALADNERPGTRAGAASIEVSDTWCAADGDMFGDAGFDVDVGIACAWG
jgi:hypothetical protein